MTHDHRERVVIASTGIATNWVADNPFGRYRGHDCVLLWQEVEAP